MAEPRWHWRNCRSFGLKIGIWAWPWARPAAFREEDVYGGERGFRIGPFDFSIAYSIGNGSAEGLERFTGLSEAKAYERAARWEGIDG